MSNLPYLDSGDLSEDTLYESDEEHYAEHRESLGPRANFRWRIRITSADLRRFLRGSPRVKVKLHGSRLPQNLADFRKCVTDACPDGNGKAFRLRSIVWPTSAYSAAPVNFSRDKWFDGDIDDVARATQQDEVYQRLLGSCAAFAAARRGALVVFDIEVHFLKAGKKAPA